MRLTVRTAWMQFGLAAVVAVVVLLVSALWKFILPPPPGYSVALLGVLAVVMTLVLPKEPSKSVKATWMMASFILMALEMWSISHDRRQQNANFNAIVDGLKTTIQESQSNINTLTGGNSFVVFHYVPGQGFLAFIHVGKYPLYNVSARLVDLQYLQRNLTFLGTTIDLGDLIPGRLYPKPVPAGFGQPDRISANIFFTARNGGWNELFRARRVKGSWQLAMRVSGLFTSLVKEETVCETISPNFPLDDSDGFGAASVPTAPKCE